MYRCMITGRNSKLGEKLNRITVESRVKTYTHTDPETDEQWQSFGVEIVKEVNASDEGVAIYNSWTEEQKRLFVASLR